MVCDRCSHAIHKSEIKSTLVKFSKSSYCGIKWVCSKCGTQGRFLFVPNDYGFSMDDNPSDIWSTVVDMWFCTDVATPAEFNKLEDMGQISPEEVMAMRALLFSRNSNALQLFNERYANIKGIING